MIFKPIQTTKLTGSAVVWLILLLVTVSGVATAAFAANDEENKELSFIFLLLRSPHARIQKWQGTQTCLQCHTEEARQVFGSVHYQWLGDAPLMLNQPASKQGKYLVAVNSYCINILGNWGNCGSCHVGLGLEPEVDESQSRLANIDCLVCHQEEYKRKKENDIFVPDLDNMKITMLEAARTVHLPRRANCLQCHAPAGGGDNFKRGDLTLAHAVTADKNFDVHMAFSPGANLSCQNCHVTQQHRIAGKGSDLRPTDLAVSMECTNCHVAQLGSRGHINPAVFQQHQERVACQTCHIPRYARNAEDTGANEMTETHRDWTVSQEVDTRYKPTISLEGDLLPQYRFWDGFSTNYLLFDQAVIDPDTGNVPTSRPAGDINSIGSKLYPFKYKTARQPLASIRNELIALDTKVYFASGDADEATRQGLVNMGYTDSEAFEYVETDTYQLITHEITPADQALSCVDCHETTEQMNLQGDLGYQPKGPTADVEGSICAQCHPWRPLPSFGTIHILMVDSAGRDCSWCHSFSRPERNLLLPPSTRSVLNK